MTPAIPTPADRRLYGDLVADVYLLRAAFKDVSRYKGRFRVNDDVVDEVGLRGMATKLREQQAAKIAARTKSKSPTAPNTPGDGAGTPAASRTGSTIAKTPCAKCGGPRSKWSVALCRGCYVPAGRAADAAPAPRNPFEKSCGGRVSVSAAGPHQPETAAPIVEATPASAPAGVVPGPQEPFNEDPAGDEPANAGGGHDVGEREPAERGVISNHLRTPPAVTSSAADCPCGRPRGHGGRCGYDRPPGPRVYPPRDYASRLTALEARQAAFEAIVRDAVAELLAKIEHIVGEGR